MAMKRRRKYVLTSQPVFANGVLAGQMMRKGMAAWLSLVNTAHPISHQDGRAIEVGAFGTNPGNLRMFAYTPNRQRARDAPLIVVMHGCGQGAATFARETGWIALADQIGATLVLPE